ncbi:MAG TPA: ABC transporter substrate-binding protein [Solirubrobacteraceae bacterium]|jgi:peptide/nickel transport system substrate-binding protein
MLSRDSEFSPEERELVDALESGRLSRRTFLSYAAGTSAALILAGCGSSSSSGGTASGGSTTGAGAGAPSSGGRVTYPLPDEVETLDPAFSTQFGERPVMLCIYDRLVTYDPNFNLKPGLARSWKLLDGGRQLLLNLQPGVKFHDGTACDAHAIKWNLDRLLEKNTNSPMASLITPPLTTVKVESPTMVRLILTKPWRPLLAALADRPGYIVSPTAAMKHGKSFGEHPVGSGPFKFKSWIHGGDITLERNPGYWQKGKPYLDEIVCMNVMDSSVALSALQTNEVQLISDVEPSLLPTVSSNTNVVVNKIRGGHWFATQYDVNKAPFNNSALRQAEGYGANRAAALKLAFSGDGVIPNSPIMTGFAAPSPGTPGPYPYNPAKAKAAVQRAGAAAHGPLQFTTATDYAIYSNLAQALQPDLKKVGLNMTLEGAQYATLYAGLQSGKYDWSETDWTPRADPDGLLRLLFYTGNAQNTTKFSDHQVDAWLDEAAQLYDVNKAKAIYEKILDVVTPDGGYNYIAMPSQVAAVRSNVGGFVQYSDDLVRLADLYIKQ